MTQTKFERRELKFLLNTNQYLKLKQYFTDRGLTPDGFSSTAKKRQYYVSSLYLDSPDYQFYWDKLYGVKDRLKYRLRTYVRKPTLTTTIYWEIKRKYGDFFIKDRFSLPWSATQKFLHHSISLTQLSKQTTKPEILTHFYSTVLKKSLKPSVLISYYREPWLDPFYPQLRLTFDYQIQAAPTQDLFYPYRYTTVLPDQIIMEIKFSGDAPGYLTQLNQLFNLQRQSVSKYCLSLEACGIVSEENFKKL